MKYINGSIISSRIASRFLSARVHHAVISGKATPDNAIAEVVTLETTRTQSVAVQAMRSTPEKRSGGAAPLA
jgi:hypothetical protein